MKNDIHGIPAAAAFEFIPEFPQLAGSEKQIAWAEQIREEIGDDLCTYALNYTSTGSRMGGEQLLEIAQKGPEAIAEDILSSPLVTAVCEDLKVEKISQAVSTYQDLADRIQRLNKLFSENTSAKFWIDHRTNQPANYRNQHFKAIIDGRI